MPGLVRRILIFAAVDGLILQPAPPRNHKPATDQAIKVEYKSNLISPIQRDRRQEDTAPQTLDSHGVIGLLQIASSSFLVSITARQQIAQIRGQAIYSIRDVALIPLSSQSDAEQAIVRAKESQQRRQLAEDDSLGADSSADEAGNISYDEGSLPGSPPSELSEAHADPKTKTSIAEDVISRKGLYGRFAERWFSKKGWKADAKRNQGISSEEDLAELRKKGQNPTLAEVEMARKDDDPAAVGSNPEHRNKDMVNKPPEEVNQALEQTAAGETVPLLSKVLTVSKMLFGSKNFYFSYEYDLSRSLKDQTSAASSLPLHRTFDPLFFWNRHLITPFQNAGQEAFVLPLIQGFVGQRAFSINPSQGQEVSQILGATSDPEEVVAMQNDSEQIAGVTNGSKDENPTKSSRDFLLTLISRRSVKRAGLRYLRRGIDDEGNVANSVETEQIMSTPDWDALPGNKIYSFVQYRGSIPLFFSQSPYSFKPVVEFSGSEATNTSAFRQHFKSLAARYGKVQAASLVETKGTEGKVGEAYAKAALAMNSEGGMDGNGNLLNFEWFDFHSVCRGMKFENVSQLFERVGPSLTAYGWTVKQRGEISQKQTGVMRTNCMDCLDRTNVVQSALARNVLESQLSDQGINIDLNSDPTTSWFNNLWADNGDAISRQYAGTAALKGDFTRTRKRNITGALTDFGLTLTRYYNNIVNDYFAQAVIDYLLGYTSVNAFKDFEADMKLQDYAVDLHKVRQGAIDTCLKICVEEKEVLVAGWVLSCPAQANSLRSLPFEECVLLLTRQALYFCRMDWSTEKVKEFERTDLESIDAIARGVYITSAVANRDLDESKNVGFVLRVVTKGRNLVRINTRSLANEKEGDSGKTREGSRDQHENSKIFAFKALPARGTYVVKSGSTESHQSEVELIKIITEQVAEAVNTTLRSSMSGKPTGEEGVYETAASADQPAQKVNVFMTVEDKDIISVSDAKRSTGYIEQLGYSLKKLVWAS